MFFVDVVTILLQRLFDYILPKLQNIFPGSDATLNLFSRALSGAGNTGQCSEVFQHNYLIVYANEA